MEARRELRAVASSGARISADRAYALTLVATEDEDKAEAAFGAIRHAELRSGQDPL